MLGPSFLASGLGLSWQPCTPGPSGPGGGNCPRLTQGGGGCGVLLTALEALAWPARAPHVWTAVCLLGVMKGCGVKANCL